MLTLITRSRQCLSEFSSKAILSLPSPSALFGRESPEAQPILEVWEVTLHMLEGRLSAEVIWNFHAQEIQLYSVIYVIMDSWIVV